MSYVRENGLERARRRRQRRSAAILLSALLIVVVGFLFSWQYINRATGSDANPNPSCSTTTQPAQSLFTLNVYNASSDSGLAKKTATAMTTRGFTVGAISNDPYGESLSGAGQVRYGPQGKEYARKYVEKLMPGATMEQDGRTDDSVDIVLGDDAPTISSVKTSTAAASGC